MVKRKNTERIAKFGRSERRARDITEMARRFFPESLCAQKGICEDERRESETSEQSPNEPPPLDAAPRVRGG